MNQREKVKKSIADCLSTVSQYCYDLKHGNISVNIANQPNGAMKNYSQSIINEEYLAIMKTVKLLQETQQYLNNQNNCLNIFLENKEDNNDQIQK